MSPLWLVALAFAITSCMPQSVPGVDYIEIFKTAPRKLLPEYDLVSDGSEKEEEVTLFDFNEYPDFDYDTSFDYESDVNETYDQYYETTSTNNFDNEILATEVVDQPENQFNNLPETSHENDNKDDNFLKRQSLLSFHDTGNSEIIGIPSNGVIQYKSSKKMPMVVQMSPILNNASSSIIGRSGLPDSDRYPRKLSRTNAKFTDIEEIEDLAAEGSKLYRRILSPQELEMLAKQRAYREAEGRYYQGLDDAISKSDILSETVRMIENGEFSKLFRHGKSLKSNKVFKSDDKKSQINLKTKEYKPKYSPSSILRTKNINNYDSAPLLPFEEVYLAKDDWKSKGFQPHPLYKNLKKLSNYPSNEKYISTADNNPNPVSEHYITKPINKPRVTYPVKKRRNQYEKKSAPLYPVMKTIPTVSRREDLKEGEPHEYVKLYIPVRAKAVSLRKIASIDKVQYPRSSYAFKSKYTNPIFSNPTTYRPKVLNSEKLNSYKKSTISTSDSSRRHYRRPSYIDQYGIHAVPVLPSDEGRYLPPLYDKEEAKFYRDPVLTPHYSNIENTKRITKEIRIPLKDKVTHQEDIFNNNRHVYQTPKTKLHRLQPSLTPVIITPNEKSRGRQSKHLQFEKMIERNVRFPTFGYDIDQYFDGFPKFGFFASEEMD